MQNQRKTCEVQQLSHRVGFDVEKENSGNPKFVRRPCLLRAVICQGKNYVDGNGHCCHRPSSNWKTNLTVTPTRAFTSNHDKSHYYLRGRILETVGL